MLVHSHFRSHRSFPLSRLVRLEIAGHRSTSRPQPLVQTGLFVIIELFVSIFCGVSSTCWRFVNHSPFQSIVRHLIVCDVSPTYLIEIKLLKFVRFSQRLFFHRVWYRHQLAYRISIFLHIRNALIFKARNSLKISVWHIGIFVALLLLCSLDAEVIRILNCVPVRVQAVDTFQRLFGCLLLLNDV
jgi:hypothetical protein